MTAAFRWFRLARKLDRSVRRSRAMKAFAIVMQLQKGDTSSVGQVKAVGDDHKGREAASLQSRRAEDRD